MHQSTYFHRRDLILFVTVVAVFCFMIRPLQSVKGFAQTQAVAAGTRSDFRRRLPLTKFYDSPEPLPAGKPGELIRSERFYDYWLSAEILAVRILYYSRSASGKDVAVSGVVLVPDRKPPAGGWPIIAWAHGFEGVARRCAPSLMGNLYKGSFLSMYVKLGYAVVATDYAGLGTNSRNAFIDMDSNAIDVIYSVQAARSAAPQLGSKWIAMGDAEGGLAAVAVGEEESRIRDPSYLGSIAISGLADMNDLYERLSQRSSPAMPPFLAYGIKSIFSQFEIGNMLTAKAWPLYYRIQTSCSGAATGTRISSDEILKPNWQRDKFVQQFFERNTLGGKRAYGPLLVISSEADPTIPISVTAQAIAKLCKQGDRVQLYTYRGPNAKGVIGESVQDQIAWIKARFADLSAHSDCP